MKTFLKKSLCVFLCIVMTVSTAAFAFAADDVNSVDAVVDTKYFQTSTDAYNADIVLDKVDEILAKENIIETIDVEVVKIVIDLRSINALCKTIDDVKDLMGNAIVWAAAKVALGDIGDINLKNWTKNMKRGSQDITILNKLFQLLSDNRAIVAKVVDGSLDLGVANSFFDIKDYIGQDGVYGLLKGLLVELVYAKGTNEYNSAYGKTLDAFLYEDLIPAKVSKADGILPGFEMNENSTVDSLLTALLASAWSKYLVPLIKGINDNWMKDSNGNIKKELQPLAEVINFNGASFDESKIKIDTTKKFADQINNVIGQLVKFFVPSAPWTNGDYKKIGDNINSVYLFIAKELGITTSNTASEKVSLDIVKYIAERIESAEVNSYLAGLASCTSIKDAFCLVLKNAAEIQGVPVTSDSKATYENILGDWLVYLLRAYVDLGYTAGGGKNVWDVLDDVANVFLFDKGVAKALGLTSLKKTDSLFTKLDKMIEMTKIFNGLTPAENYKTENFLKDIIDALFSLDLAEAADMTVVRFLGDFGNKKVVEVLYNAIYNSLKAAFSKEIICAYAKTNPLDTVISNAKLKTTVKNLLEALNSKKAAIIPPVLYAGALLIGSTDKAASISAANQIYTGQQVLPEKVTLTIGSKKFNLVLGHDYTATSSAATYNVGDTVTAALSLNGFAEGSAVVTYKIVLAPVSTLKASSVTSNSATLSWNSVVGAEKYEILSGSKVVASTDKTSYKLSSLASGKDFEYSVRAVSGTNSSEQKSVKFTTLPATVKSLKASTVKDTSLKLSWAAASGATGYKIEKSTDKKKWTTVKTVTDTSYTVTGLNASTTYYFRVTAYAKTAASTVYGTSSSVISAKTVIATVTGLKVKSATDTSITYTWTAVKNAKGYKVEYSTDGKKWTAKTTTSTSYTLSKLSANKTYYVRVTAYDSAKKYGAASASLKMSTAPTKISSLKVKSTTSTTITLTWAKLSGATGYEVSYSTDGKKWNKTTTTSNSITLKKLSSNKKYQIKIRPYKKTGSYTAYGQFSSVVKATTNVAAPTSLKSSSVTKNSLKLSWKKVSGASGYEVYRNGKKVKTITKGSTVSFSDKKLSRNTTYKYKVRAYKTVSGKKVYSDYSSQISVRTKLF